VPTRLKIYKLATTVASIYAQALAAAARAGVAASEFSLGMQQLLAKPDQLHALLLVRVALCVQAEYQEQRGRTQLPEAAAAAAAALQQYRGVQQQQQQQQKQQQQQRRQLQGQVEPWHEQLLLSLGVPADELCIVAKVEPAAAVTVETCNVLHKTASALNCHLLRTPLAALASSSSSSTASSSSSSQLEGSGSNNSCGATLIHRTLLQALPCASAMHLPLLGTLLEQLLLIPATSVLQDSAAASKDTAVSAVAALELLRGLTSSCMPADKVSTTAAGRPATALVAAAATAAAQAATVHAQPSPPSAELFSAVTTAVLHTGPALLILAKQGDVAIAECSSTGASLSNSLLQHFGALVVELMQACSVKPGETAVQCCSTVPNAYLAM
jgi:hypothetical protein